MNPLAHTTLAFALAALLPIQPSEAQSRSSMASAAPVAIGAAAANPAELTEISNRAYALLEQGRFREARREYTALANRQREQKLFAGEALWHIAAISHNQGNIRHAAATLDRLAEEAQAHGQPEYQAKALLEAAILYHRLRQPERALERVARLKPLSSSPHLSADLRDQIQTRIKG
jgi:tetratricopeptide (TPR) repeat protein